MCDIQRIDSLERILLSSYCATYRLPCNMMENDSDTSFESISEYEMPNKKKIKYVQPECKINNEDIMSSIEKDKEELKHIQLVVLPELHAKYNKMKIDLEDEYEDNRERLRSSRRKEHFKLIRSYLNKRELSDEHFDCYYKTDNGRLIIKNLIRNKSLKLFSEYSDKKSVMRSKMAIETNLISMNKNNRKKEISHEKMTILKRKRSNYYSIQKRIARNEQLLKNCN